MWNMQTASCCFWVAICLLLSLHIPRSRGENIELTTSSQFSMILVPVSDRLQSEDLQAIERAVATVLLSLVGNEVDYLNMETVIQESDFLDSQQSKIRFFVVATTSETLGSLKDKLDRLLNESLFGSVLGREAFLEAVRESNRERLQNVDSVKVVPIITSPSSSADSKEGSKSEKRLSTLDIILICVSGLIFGGICYMIFERNKDQGYIESQRVRVANLPIRETEADISLQDLAPRSVHILPKVVTPDHPQDAPLTPTTLNSNEFHTHSPTKSYHSSTQSPAANRALPSSSSAVVSLSSLAKGSMLLSDNEIPSKPKSAMSAPFPAMPLSGPLISIASIDESSSGSTTKSKPTNPPPSSRAIFALSSIDSSSKRSLSESIESVWFETPNTVSSSARPSQSNKTGGKDGSKSNKGGTTMILSKDSVHSEGSKDFFFVDAENPSTNVCGESSRSSAAISEWMKSIRVVSFSSTGSALGEIGTKTSDMTHGTPEPSSSSSSSTGPSECVASTDATSIDHRSLEQSMASSEVGEQKSASSIVEV